MTTRVRFRPEAAADVADAHAWYERQRAGLGTEFEEAVSAALALVAERPRAFPVVHRRLRRLLLQRFPYALYYRIEADDVEIIARLHTRRHPRRWHRRSRD